MRYETPSLFFIQPHTVNAYKINHSALKYTVHRWECGETDWRLVTSTAFSSRSLYVLPHRREETVERFTPRSLGAFFFFTWRFQTPHTWHTLVSGCLHLHINVWSPYLTRRLPNTHMRAFLSRKVHSLSLFHRWLLLARSDLQLSTLILQWMFSLLNPRIT